MADGPKKNMSFDIFGNLYPLPLTEPASRTKEQILMEGTLLFARHGYASVSMRDLAEVIGIKPASLYNHFASKEALWEAVLGQSVDLYLLYFRQLDEAMGRADTFAELLETAFTEPKKLTNLFTCYAFALVQSEQFRDERCGVIYNGTFLEYSIEFFQNWFEKFIDRGLVPRFETKMVATIIMHGVLINLNVKVQELLGRLTPYDPGQMMGDLQQFILRTVFSAPFSETL